MVIVSAAVVDDETFVFGGNRDETYTGANPPRQTKLLASKLDGGWNGKNLTTIALSDVVTSEPDPDPIFSWDMCSTATDTAAHALSAFALLQNLVP